MPETHDLTLIELKQLCEPQPSQEWLNWKDEYDVLVAEGKPLWDATGLPDNIYEGWQKARGKGELHSCGLFPVPMEVMETSHLMVERALELACVPRKTQSFDPGYVDELEQKIKRLEKELKRRQDNVNTLTELVAELRLKVNKPKIGGEVQIFDDIGDN